MFRLSTRSSYGLRACLALACAPPDQPMAVADLSKENQIPRRYLEQILNSLRHKGLVTSTRGARGGYHLARRPSSISIGEIVRAVEGEMEAILCSVPEMRSHTCRTTTGCVSRRLCYDLETTLLRVLDGTTLEDMRLEAVRLQSAARGDSVAVSLSKILPIETKNEVNYV